MNARELAWAAGLFEGEGSFSSRPEGYPVTSLGMTDEDSVRRFYAAVGVGYVFPARPRPDRPSYKMIWRWQAAAFEDVQAVVALLWFGLGKRRRARAKEVLAGTPPCRACRSPHLHKA